MKHPLRLAAAALSVAFTLPFTADTLNSGFVADIINVPFKEFRDQALKDRPAWTQHVRDYVKALEICGQRVLAGEELTCPTINDHEGIKAMLKGEDTTMHSAAEEESSSSASSEESITVPALSDLPAGTRSMIRRYQRLGTCPENLTAAGEGVLELCESLLETEDRYNESPLNVIRARVRNSLQK
jgi:hypothetical protein